jgi:hypothetical protein
LIGAGRRFMARSPGLAVDQRLIAMFDWLQA